MILELDGDILRDLEARSIFDFLVGAAKVFDGQTVLDYGCGKQPYRDLVESVGGRYFPYDRASFPGSVSGEDIGGDESDTGCGPFGVLLVTQVIQYFRPDDLRFMMGHFRRLLSRRGALVMSYPTTWPEVEHEDMLRFTQHGMARLLNDTGFEIETHQRRGPLIGWPGFRLALGYGVVARAR